MSTSGCSTFKFRRQHEQLRTVIVRVLRPTLASHQLGGQPRPVEAPVEEAVPELLAWEAAMKRYDERIETRITARLRDQLGMAKNANEMFRIFSRFNALFVRPHIKQI